MTHQVSKGGSFRIDRRFKGVGRIAIASRTTNRQRFRAYNSMLEELFEDGRLDILRAIRDRQITVQQAYAAKRTHRLPYLASELVLHEGLWPAVEQWLPKSARAPSSRNRYRVSFRALKKSGALSTQASVSDLRNVDWSGLRETWRAGPADWNRMRSAVSRFLTMTLEDKFHPVRREIMARLPKAAEPAGRVPELSTALFWRIVSEAPIHVRSCYVTLATTGLRVGEYLALDESNLRPITKEIEVPGTKTVASNDVIRVGEEAWKHVVAAVPAPVRYKWLYTHWKRACRACDAPELTLHDLRHFYGQSLVDAARSEASVQQSLRHADPTMTRRYTKRKDQGENALAMDEILFPPVRRKPSKEA